MEFFAKRVGSDFTLFVRCEGYASKIGRLADCEVTHIFESDDEELVDYVRLEGDMSIREMLVQVRLGYVALQARHTSEAKAEMYAEGAWLRQAESPTLDDMGFEAWERDRGVI